MATTSFTLKILETSEIQHKTDKFYLMELTGKELRNDDRENILKVQANNLFADKLLGVSSGDVVSFICEIEGRIWNKSEDKRIVFQNLVVKEFNVLQSEQKQQAYTGNPKKADVNDMFVNRRPESPPASAAQEFGFDNDLPF